MMPLKELPPLLLVTFHHSMTMTAIMILKACNASGFFDKRLLLWRERISLRRMGMLRIMVTRQATMQLDMDTIRIILRPPKRRRELKKNDAVDAEYCRNTEAII